MKKFEISFYTDSHGRQPAKDFLLSLDIKMRAKMMRTIDLLADNGPQLREPYSKNLTDGIFELRAKVGSNISRVLYFFIVGKQVILSHGFIKKSPKTPHAEIARAKTYKADYLERSEHDEQL